MQFPTFVVENMKSFKNLKVTKTQKLETKIEKNFK